jgi:ribosomal protein L6P/L9E
MYLYAYFTQVKFLTKTSLVVFGINKNDVNINTQKIFNWRPLNVFTGRGVRFAKQVVYKKAGKVSSYR